MRPRGLSLAVTLMALGVIAVLGLGLATIGMQQLNRSRLMYVDRKALYAATAGVEACLRELRRDWTWNAGIPQTVLSPETSYEVVLTNNFQGATDLTAPNGARVPAGATYLTATGTSGERSRRLGVMLRARFGRFSYAIGAAGPVTLGSSVTVTGPFKADGLLTANSSLTMLPERGDGRLLGGASITTGIDGRIKMDATQAVRARADISPGPPFTSITGTTLIYENDATSATDPFVTDGRLTGDAPTGFLPFPNPDTTKLLAAADVVDHSGVTSINSTLDLGGKVHYFPQGVVFGVSSAFTGRGTVVIGNGATGEFLAPIGTNTGGHPLNIVALGDAGGSKLIFRESTSIEGVVYSHEDIETAASFRVEGSLFTYRGSTAELTASDAFEVVQADLAVPIKGFEPWMTPPSVSVQSWQPL